VAPRQGCGGYCGRRESKREVVIRTLLLVVQPARSDCSARTSKDRDRQNLDGRTSFPRPSSVAVLRSCRPRGCWRVHRRNGSAHPSEDPYAESSAASGTHFRKADLTSLGC